MKIRTRTLCKAEGSFAAPWVAGDKRPANEARDGFPEDTTLALVPPRSREPLMPAKHKTLTND